MFHGWQTFFYMIGFVLWSFVLYGYKGSQMGICLEEGEIEPQAHENKVTRMETEN